MTADRKTQGNPGCSMYEIISKKRDGKNLTKDEIKFFIDGYVDDSIPDYQAAALLMAIYWRGLNSRELSLFTGIMMHSGDTISLDGVAGKKIDKHSTGGVGDKVSFIVSPLAAACGVKVPMLSGRGLGHTGGTLDKLESIPGFRVSLQTGEFKRTLAEVGMVICGQTKNVVPADKKLYALRDATATISSVPLITSSIMSKKLALGTDGIVLDVKTGAGAFMKDSREALKLCKTMVETGENSGRKMIGLITRMDQPLGRAVGNSLEIIESIEVLKGNGPADLLEVSFAVGACMLEAAGVSGNYDHARDLLQEALDSGKALEIFKKFIKAQGGNDQVCENYNLLPGAEIQSSLTAHQDGYITAINALEVGLAAVEIGAGRSQKEDIIDFSAGFLFEKKSGDAVKKGEDIVFIHAHDREKAKKAKERLRRAITIAPRPVPEAPMILYRVDKDGFKSI